ncbi:hypothetical protein LAC81_02075 [Ensifer adhaerens]|uniref:hypothetical protein n=1 Tax=Ensifer adhaerens TaxID=106592 RepID=UPI001CC06DFE|nr:hypothetical protein [Ensifer adhaerens]MBZ7920574.1 hypothetical protein [Ensifer adhaerens]UAX93049.1 hypothetical protein LAC78_02070 [Ensifer adhaerens]UAY00685.1 hypothetical protein LAC80_02075 [Ensifer adhaerens]UAY08066.1 hypothetical protein LAC81_02075 [Ensifer adhaerens]
MPAAQQQSETTELDELAAALAWHDGDAVATIRTLLDDCRQLREQLALAEISMSLGFTRGWRPSCADKEGAQPTA